MSEAEITVIAAVAQNGVIGLDDDIPWKSYDADMKHFREKTSGHPVILGRVTYESILDKLGSPLPDRQNIVVSQSHHFKRENVRTVNSPGSAISLALSIDDEAYVAGGESIYKALIPLSNRMLITEIPEAPEGDSVFPGVGRRWVETERREGPDGLEFVEYRKRTTLTSA